MMNIEFANPLYLLLLLLLIPLVAWYIIKLTKTNASLKLSSTTAYNNHPKTLKVYLRHLPFVLRTIAIALIIVVIARPQNYDSTSTTESQGIDIILAMDVSSSMLAQDFQPNRIEASKKVASNFINSRPNDRIGLVIFSSESFTLCPLTTDRGILLNLVHQVKLGTYMGLTDGTAIGLGLANSVNCLKNSPSKSKVVILLTDGSNNRGEISPMTAAALAKRYGIRVYTIGVGSNGMAPYPMQTSSGETVMTTIPCDLDEVVLKGIANESGGEYFRATDNESLRKIYTQIDKLEKTHIKTKDVTTRNELYLPFLLIAMGLILIEFVLRKTWLRSIT